MNHHPRRWAAALACALALPAAARAQNAAAIPTGPRTLALEEAQALARTHNPSVAQSANEVRMAGHTVRSAYGELLPGLSLSNSFGYTAPGERRVGSVSLGDQPSIYSSHYGVSATYSVTAARVLQPRIARSEAREAEWRATRAGTDLTTEVARRYIALLQAQARLRQVEREAVRSDEHMRQGQAQADAGLTSPLDRKRAEVQRSQVEVRRLQALRTVRTETVALGRSLGMAMEPGVELTSTFAVFEPRWTAEELVAMGMRGNAGLRAARGSVESARARAGASRAAYLPTLSISLNLTGWIQSAGDVEMLVQQRIGGRTVTAEAEADIRDRVRRENQGFPFSYNRQPVNASATVSLPVFQGFGRRAQVERSRAAVEDAEGRRRSEQLRVHAEITTALTNLRSGYDVARAQTVVRSLAAEELQLARARLRLGAGNEIAVSDAQVRLSQAEVDEIDAVYTFHQTLVELEALVGASLR
ncbi:MAG TPA: TolC family protein [Longimicrobium sp.]|jgi:outer membrane protein